MNEILFQVVNLVGLFVFCLMAMGVYCLVSQRYWDSGKYGPYDLPWWVEDGIFLFFVLLWGGIIVTLMLTVWKPDPVAIYTISISW